MAASDAEDDGALALRPAQDGELAAAPTEGIPRAGSPGVARPDPAPAERPDDSRGFVPWPAADRSEPAPVVHGSVGLRRRLAGAFDAVSAWLPIVLMALMALGSWWLVKNTPLLEAPRPAAAPRHEPDSTMNDFLVQRFAPSGPLRVQIEGARMRHYPDDDTYEIDDARIRSVGADGQVLVATARRAVANRDASEVQLSGGAHVVREATATEAAIDFRGEFLDIVQPTEELRSNLPVVVTQGGNEVHAEAMRYDHLNRMLELRGRVRAVLTPTGRPAVPATPADPGSGARR